MQVLSSAELVSLKAAVEAHFPDTCTIQTVTESVDALGGVVHTWANTHTGIACRLDQQGFGSESVNDAALEGESIYDLSLASTQAISIEDRVIFNGKTYEVQAVQDAHSDEIVRKARLIRVDSG